MSPVLSDPRAARLRAQVAGPVFAAEDEGMGRETSAFNLAAVHRPALAVGATSTSDVAAAVRFAAGHALPLAVQSTGHGAVAGVGEGVMVSTRRMSRVWVDPVTATARAEAGATLGRVLEAAAPHGLAPLNGSSTGVGLGGYVLGGGLPLLGRTFGFAADHVRSFEIVTADGRVRQAGPDTEPDLYWAVRGAGAGFGVVTWLEIELVPVSTIFGGALFYPGEAIGDVLHAFREWTPALPDAMTASIAVLRLPDSADVPPPIAGKLSVNLRVAFAGEASEGARLLAPMRRAAPVLIDSAGERPYRGCDEIYHDPVDPIPLWHRGALLRELPAEAVDRLVEVAGRPQPSPLMLVEMRHLGGALGRPPAIPNAVTARDGAYSLMVAGVSSPGDGGVAEAGTRVLEALRPWCTGGAVLNLAGELGPDELAAAWPPEVYARLKSLKRAVDPDNMLRFGNVVTP